MEIIQNQKSINQCKDNQNTESTSNPGRFNMEQLRKEIESQQNKINHTVTTQQNKPYCHNTTK